MMLSPGERVTDEARFLASHTRYIASLKGKAREAYEANLKRFNQVKNNPKS